jgi:hypothetical protein
MTRAEIRVRISRVAIDAAALGGSSHAQFAESLQQAIVQRLTSQVDGQHGGLANLVAEKVASRIGATAPGRASTQSDSGR